MNRPVNSISNSYSCVVKNYNFEYILKKLGWTVSSYPSNLSFDYDTSPDQVYYHKIHIELEESSLSFSSRSEFIQKTIAKTMQECKKLMPYSSIARFLNAAEFNKLESMCDTGNCVIGVEPGFLPKFSGMFNGPTELDNFYYSLYKGPSVEGKSTFFNQENKFEKMPTDDWRLYDSDDLVKVRLNDMNSKSAGDFYPNGNQIYFYIKNGKLIEASVNTFNHQTIKNFKYTGICEIRISDCNKNPNFTCPHGLAAKKCFSEQTEEQICLACHKHTHWLQGSTCHEMPLAVRKMLYPDLYPDIKDTLFFYLKGIIILGNFFW